MSDDQREHGRLLAMLGDAMVACIWAAVVLYALTLLSWVLFLTTRATFVTAVAQWSGVSTDTMAIIWVCALALLKLTALSFAATAFGLWVWKRRLARRIAK